MPDLSGQNPVDAMAQLSEAGLRAELKNELSLDGNPGKIVRSEPPAGDQQAVDDPVTLFVSARGGWVYLGRGKQVSVTSTPVASPTTGYLRATDHDTGNKIGVVQKGEQVTVLESRPSGWTLVQAENL